MAVSSGPCNEGCGYGEQLETYVAAEGVAGVLAVEVRLVGVVGRVQLLDGGEHFCTMQAGSPGRY